MTTELGGTLDIKGHVHYKGSRDELNDKCRERDDEIDRLRKRIVDLEDKVSMLKQEILDLQDQKAM